MGVGARADEGVATTKAGTGLGLYLAARLAGLGLYLAARLAGLGLYLAARLAGLGLYLAARLAGAGGMELGYRPNEPRGARFVVTLPRDPSRAPQASRLGSRVTQPH